MRQPHSIMGIMLFCGRLLISESVTDSIVGICSIPKTVLTELKQVSLRFMSCLQEFLRQICDFIFRSASNWEKQPSIRRCLQKYSLRNPISTNLPQVPKLSFPKRF